MENDLISRSALTEEFKRLGLGEHGLVERLFADGVYAVIETFPAVDAEKIFEAVGLVKEAFDMAKADLIPVRHGRWVDRYGGKYANQLYECSECKGTALYKYEVDVLGKGHFVQALSSACPHCRAKMDKEEY